MYKRPIAITIICWILIVLSCFSLIADLFIFLNPQKLAALKAQLNTTATITNYVLAISFINPVVNFILAIAMLNAKRWGRTLYLIYNAVVYLIALIFSPQKLTMIIVIVIFLIFLYFLYNKSAQEYFTGKKD